MRSALAGLALCSTCFAQDASVVITAPRFPEEIRRMPASVTVITREDIAKSAARTLPELISSEVGFTMKDFYGNNAAYTSVDLRGFGVTGPQNTLILLDGRRLNDFDLSGVQWPAIPLASIERVETEVRHNTLFIESKPRDWFMSNNRRRITLKIIFTPGSPTSPGTWPGRAWSGSWTEPLPRS